MTAATDHSLLEIQGISRRFSGIVALSSVSLTIRAGQGHALLGENGAGKSTLIKIISGQLKPDDGRLLIDGAPVSFDNAAAALGVGISIVPQEACLVPELTVAENILLGAFPTRLAAVDYAALHRQAETILGRLGLDLDPRGKAGDLSPGAQRLVEIARGLSKHARLFILDEPTAALTEVEAEKLFRILADLKRTGCAVLYVSHRLREIARVAEDITVLRDGRVVKGWTGESVSEADLVNAMVGRIVDRAPRGAGSASDSPVPALRVDKLCRGDMLHDVSFSVARGEILALSGLIGAGRTEILRTIFGADPMDSGRIVVDGRAVTFASPVDAIRAGIAMVPEERKAQGIVEIMSIADNASLASLRRWSWAGFLRDAPRRRDVAAGVRMFGLKYGRLDDAVSTLSGGNQQKVVFAKWLSRAPKVFLLDEPTRGIDIKAKLEIYQIIRDLAKQGCAVIVASSELPEVLHLADRILVIREGRIVDEVRGEVATEQSLLNSAMKGLGGRQPALEGAAAPA